MFNLFFKKQLPYGCSLETNGKQWRAIMADGYKTMAYNTKRQAINIAVYLEECEKKSKHSIWIKVK
jgi:hypothetical protein